MKHSTNVKRFERNTVGRDLVIGDIHGCFTKARAALDAIGFNPDSGDRLFSVGDLVDRGPESAEVMNWLDKQWFHAVQGNHEDMAIRWGLHGCRMDRELYAQNGGAWNIANTAPERLKYSDALAALPLAIEVETAAGLVGIVHADCPTRNWSELLELLSCDLGETTMKAVKQRILWDRSRLEFGDALGVPDIRAMVVGHTPQDVPLWLGNVLYLDTAAWHQGGATNRQFAIYDLATLRPATA